MADVRTLSKAALEHPGLDYAHLRREGIRYLESLIGHVWTDFNTHDPGITILEQLCYAITDLAYRASHDIPDLLASSGGDPYGSLYSASTILTSHPVTMLDLRKLIIDVDGVKNAWIEPIADPRPALQAREDKRELGFQADPPYTTPVMRKGLVRVVIETSDLVDRAVVELRREVAHRLFACRPLCTDLEEIQVLDSQPIQVHARVEIGPVDDAERVLLAIYEALSDEISPSVSFKTLGEMLAAGLRSDEIFDGPALHHGFLDPKALDGLRRKDAIRTSDLLQRIMRVSGVRAVSSIEVSAKDGAREPWILTLDANRTPRLDLRGSSIVLMKGHVTARPDATRLIETLVERRKQAASRSKLAPGDRDFAQPEGRDRNIAQYRSIQYELPAIYGVGAAGLPDATTSKRRAQAKQLKAYLLFFDQLLASLFAQLAHAGSLFSFHEKDRRTYFTQMVDEEDALGVSEVRTFDATAHREHLESSIEDKDSSGSLSSRKNRFLNHLSARFAEQFTDYSLVLFGASNESPDDGELVADKQAFLQRYPRVSSARGTGMDLLSSGSADSVTGPESGSVSGLQERIERKLGVSAEHGERLLVIEHVLLAPMNEDNIPPSERDYRQLPFLADAVSRDPFSLQLSVVPSWRGRLRRNSNDVTEFHRLVDHTVRDETPAHLTPFLHWPSDDTQWSLFERAYEEWRDAYRSYLAAKLGLGSLDAPRHVQMRAARDQLIDLLGFGKTYPLRDLSVKGEWLTVPFNQPARIPIESSQRGVIYELRDDSDELREDSSELREDSSELRDDSELLDARDRPPAAEGNGGTIFLQTLPMQEDTTFRILARRKEAPMRWVYLQQRATVKVGLDRTLHARIIGADLLDPSIERPADKDPRIVDWGARVSVQIDHSQEGVDYHLVIRDPQEQRLSVDVRGNLDDIVITTEPIHEDLDLSIRATKVFDPSEKRPTHTELLEIVLPLKIRTRVDLPVSTEPSSLVDHGAGAIVRIDDTQTDAEYRLHVRDVGDSIGRIRGDQQASIEHSRFIRVVSDGGSGPDELQFVAADVDSEPRVYVLRPPWRSVWEDFEGFQPVGAPVQGNGSTLRLPVSVLHHDSVVLVRARKNHRHDAADVSSSVQLKQAAVILVRPDPNPALEINVIMDGTQTTGTLEITGGDAGVLYQLRREPDGPDLGLAVYFHQTDERDRVLNKGIDRRTTRGIPYGLEIDVDFAISRGTQPVATTRAEPATTPPLSPVVVTGPLDAGTMLHVRAVKAQTRAAVLLPRTAQIAPVPRIGAEPAVISAGNQTTIAVRASVAGERYQLAQDAQLLGAARDGDGSDLVFTTAAVFQNTRFQVLVTRPGGPGISVRRIVEILVTVAPQDP